MMFPTRFSVLAGSFLVLHMLIGSRTCDAHKDGAYMRNANDGFESRVNWMDEIRDDVQLTELAIPGTDISAAYKKLGTAGEVSRAFFKSLQTDWTNQNPIASINEIGDIVTIDIQTTQCLNFRQQLQYGIRVFDISLVFRDSTFGLIHRDHDTFLDLTFDQFLTQLANFLGENPSETIMFTLKIKEEVGESSKTPKNVLKEYLEASPIDEYYFKPSSSQVTLGEARGKFIIISKDYNFNEFGLVEKGGDFVTMGRNYLATNWDLHDKKWLLAKNHMINARSGDKNKFYMDYISGFGGSFPYFVASGHVSPQTNAARLSTGLTIPGFASYYPDFPRTTCFMGICTISFEGTNTLTRNLVQGFNNDIDNQQRTVGMILANFPGDSLIQTIINNNEKLKK